LHDFDDLFLTFQVTHSFAEYEELAYTLATNQSKLQRIKKIIEERKQSVALFDTELYVRNFESGLKKAWELFLNESSPQHIRVP
jgi:predicted O-linked N-acetylglucosamine transferase (SPINDLY family)